MRRVSVWIKWDETSNIFSSVQEYNDCPTARKDGIDSGSKRRSKRNIKLIKPIYRSFNILKQMLEYTLFLKRVYHWSILYMRLYWPCDRHTQMDKLHLACEKQPTKSIWVEAMVCISFVLLYFRAGHSAISLCIIGN